MRPVLTVLFTIFLCSCEGLSKKHVTKDFYLIDMDYIKEERSLHFEYSEGGYPGIVGPTVVGYALSGKYILVKQKPKFFLESKSARKPVYYIVDTDVERLLMPEQGVTGPLTLTDFNRACQKLGIPTNVRFEED